MKKLALWIAAKCGAQFAHRPEQAIIDSAHEFAAHVDHQREPWEWKHRQALRALMNRYPHNKIRDLNLAIEIAIQERACSGR